MAVTFEITRVDKMSRAGVGVLDGTLRGGSIRPLSTVQLVHEGRCYPLEVMGVVTDRVSPRSDNSVSLSFKLRQAGMQLVKVGDSLVCDSEK